MHTEQLVEAHAFHLVVMNPLHATDLRPGASVLHEIPSDQRERFAGWRDICICTSGL